MKYHLHLNLLFSTTFSLFRALLIRSFSALFKLKISWFQAKICYEIFSIQIVLTDAEKFVLISFFVVFSFLKLELNIYLKKQNQKKKKEGQGDERMKKINIKTKQNKNKKILNHLLSFFLAENEPPILLTSYNI